MVSIRPDQEIDHSLSSYELLATETQNWFDLLHHYESGASGLSAPTEGSVDVMAQRGTKNLLELRNLSAIGDLLLSAGSPIKVNSRVHIAAVQYGNPCSPTMHALRRGFDNPADDRRHPVREARSITPLEQKDSSRIIEAGLGFAFFGLSRGLDLSRNNLDRSVAGYRITLSHKGDDKEVVARRIEKIYNEEQVTAETQVSPAVVRGFMQIFRNTMWNTVYEPA